MFNNAKQVIINDKVVKSITLASNSDAYLYKAPSLVLTSDTLVGCVGDTVNLTAVLSDYPGGNSGKTVYFVSDSVEVTTDTLLTSTYEGVKFTLEDDGELVFDNLISAFKVYDSSNTRKLTGSTTVGYDYAYIRLIKEDDTLTVKSYMGSTSYDNLTDNDWTTVVSYTDDESIFSVWIQSPVTLLENTFVDCIYETGVTDATGTANVSFLLKDTDSLNIKANVERIILSETCNIESYLLYSIDGSRLDGTFTLTDGYITNCNSDTGITSINIPSNFEFTHKYYLSTTPPSETQHWYNALWSIGADNNNGILIGIEASRRRIRIYNLTNGTPTSISIQTYVFNVSEWVEVKISYQNGLWSITVNDNTLTYNKSFTPSFIHLYDDYMYCRLKEVKLKTL